MTLKKVLRVGASVLIVALLGLSLACSGVQKAAQKQKEANDLKQIALEYQNYHDNKLKGPATLDEFVAFAQMDFPPQLTSDLKSGKYVIYLGVEISKLPQAASNTVLAYEAAAPTSGGQVVMADGFVKTMTASEFASAAKPPNAKPSQP